MAALGSSLVFSQAAMAADTTAKTETSEDADKDATESEDKDVAEDADKADEEKEDLKTIGEKPEEDTEGVFSVKLKNLTGKVITGVTVKNEKDEEKRKEYTEVLERKSLRLKALIEDLFEMISSKQMRKEFSGLIRMLKIKQMRKTRILQMIQKRPQILKKQKQKMPKQMKKQKAKIRMMLRKKSRNIIFS